MSDDAASTAITQSKPEKDERVTKYYLKYPDVAYKLCLLGATDEDMAQFFEVATSTIYAWKNDHPEFAEQIRNGKKFADMHIAHKLFNRAEGAEWTEEQAFKIKEEFFDDSGKKVRTEERIVTVPVRKVAAPDTTAIIFWLKNRDAKNWRDKQELQHTGKDGDALPEAALANLPPEALLELLAINQRIASSASDGADEPGEDPG